MIFFLKKLPFKYYILLLKLSPFMILVDPVAKLRREYIIPVVKSMQNYTDPMDWARINFFYSHNCI